MANDVKFFWEAKQTKDLIVSMGFHVREVIGDFSKSFYYNTMVLSLESFALLSSTMGHLESLETFLAITTQYGDMPWASRR